MVLANVFMAKRDEDIQWDEPDTTLKFQHSGCLLPSIIVKGLFFPVRITFSDFSSSYPIPNFGGINFRGAT